MKPTHSSPQNRAIQERVDTALSILKEREGFERIAQRLRGCGGAHHRDVFLGQRQLDDGAKSSTRAGVGCCEGSNYCPRCHISAAAERVERTLAICAAHLGNGEKPTVNQKLVEDGLATPDLVPVVMLFTVTVPRKGGAKEEWAKDVERFEHVRRKFFDVKKNSLYWGKLKERYRILSFVRATDVTYQLFGEMSGPHWHGHGLFFALMEREKWEKICREDKQKEAFEDEVSQCFYEEWQRAASNVDPEIKIQKPFRSQGKLKGGVTVELARDLNAASQYIAKNMAFEMAFTAGKIAKASDKYTWPELVEMQTLKDYDGKPIFSNDVRDAAKNLYVFHASQASRDQFTIGNIKGRITIETYYCGNKEERDEKKKEERLEKEGDTTFTHRASKIDYNSASRLEVEASVDAYEEGNDVNNVSKVWKKEKRTQEQIRARIKDNEDYVQEKSAIGRVKKGCKAKKTLERAMAWCVRNLDYRGYAVYRDTLEKLYSVISDRVSK